MIFEQNAKIYAYDRSGKKVDVEIIPNTVKVGSYGFFL